MQIDTCVCPAVHRQRKLALQTKQTLCGQFLSPCGCTRRPFACRPYTAGTAWCTWRSPAATGTAHRRNISSSQLRRVLRAVLAATSHGWKRGDATENGYATQAGASCIEDPTSHLHVLLGLLVHPARVARLGAGRERMRRGVHEAVHLTTNTADRSAVRYVFRRSLAAGSLAEYTSKPEQ